MSTTRASVDLDRNAGAFDAPRALTLPELLHAVTTAMQRIQRTFQRLKVWYDATNANVDGLLGDVTTIQGNVTTIQGDITDLETALTALTVLVTTLETTVVGVPVDIYQYQWDSSTGQLQQRAKTITVLADGTWGAWADIAVYEDCP